VIAAPVFVRSAPHPPRVDPDDPVRRDCEGDRDAAASDAMLGLARKLAARHVEAACARWGLRGETRPRKKMKKVNPASGNRPRAGSN
jgi:hypothetical protein